MATGQLYLGGDRRSVRPWIVGLVLVVGAAVTLFWLTAGGGDRSRQSESSTSQLGAIGQPSAPIEQPANNVAGGAVETSELFAPKDPFDPLISTSSQAGGRTAGSSARSSRGPAGIGERKVLLVASTSRHGGSAEVRVDGTSYTVARGETFADHFKLLAASGDCVAMLFGDQEFTLCEGDEILK
jgi:hypothetical protein